MVHKCPEARREYHRKYMREYRKSATAKAYASAAFKKYSAANREHLTAANYAWRLANPVAWRKIARRSGRRRHEQKRSTEFVGIGLINTAIELFYDTRDLVSEITGVEHHVDHIKPLAKGGQHIPWNLQVLTASANLKKGATYNE